jgi:nucleoside-diphosphate-sugar epimerase
VGAVAAAAWVVERGLRLARRRSPVSYHQVRRATQAARFDCGRAERLLGWRPMVGIEEGLRRAFASLGNGSRNGGAPTLGVSS